MKIKFSLIKKIFNYFLNDLIFLLSNIFPKDNKLWLFGSWYGNTFSDNSKYLYLHVIENHPEIKVYWITKNKNVYKYLKENNLPVLKRNSLKGMWYMLRGKVWIYSASKNDIFVPFFTKRNIGVQLWHGIGIKRIGYSASVGSFSSFYKIKIKLLPYSKLYKHDIVISTSKLWQDRFSEAFNMPKDKIPITGLPRCDIFYKKIPKNKDYIQILFTPTHRKQGKGNIVNIIPDEKIMRQINEFLKERNLIFKMKLHYYDMKYVPKNVKFSNIEIIDFDPLYDIQEELLNSDILLVDYSGIYFDFLLLDRPVIFTAFDLEEYEKHDQGLYEPFENIAAGKIAKNWNEVLEGIEEAIKEPDKYKEKRKKVRDRYWDISVQDGNASKRVFDIIKNHPKLILR